MSAYTLELLGRAVEVVHARKQMFVSHPPSFFRGEVTACAWGTPDSVVLKVTPKSTRAATLADALAALLADLGEQVPERPSAEQVADVEMELHARAYGSLGHWRDLYASDRLAVLVLLEGDDGEEAAR